MNTCCFLVYGRLCNNTEQKKNFLKFFVEPFVETFCLDKIDVYVSYPKKTKEEISKPVLNGFYGGDKKDSFYENNKNLKSIFDLVEVTTNDDDKEDISVYKENMRKYVETSSENMIAMFKNKNNLGKMLSLQSYFKNYSVYVVLRDDIVYTKTIDVRDLKNLGNLSRDSLFIPGVYKDFIDYRGICDLMAFSFEIEPMTKHLSTYEKILDYAKKYSKDKHIIANPEILTKITLKEENIKFERFSGIFECVADRKNRFRRMI